MDVKNTSYFIYIMELKTKGNPTIDMVDLDYNISPLEKHTHPYTRIPIILIKQTL